MFPGPGAQVYYNDAGEPLGWDYPSDDPDLDYDERAEEAAEAANEAAYDWGYSDGREGVAPRWDDFRKHRDAYGEGYDDGRAERHEEVVEPFDDDSHLAQYDDDPSPYDGTYSEE